jgi:hypothetical protein
VGDSDDSDSDEQLDPESAGVGVEPDALSDVSSVSGDAPDTPREALGIALWRPHMIDHMLETTMARLPKGEKGGKGGRGRGRGRQGLAAPLPTDRSKASTFSVPGPIPFQYRLTETGSWVGVVRWVRGGAVERE